MLGARNIEIYGTQTLKDLEKATADFAISKNAMLDCIQSNHEGNIIDALQTAHQNYNGIILNAGAYTHYSYAIRDAIECAEIPVVEVHLSNIMDREQFRAHSVLKPVCVAQFFGDGIYSYCKAISFLIDRMG